MRWLKTICVAGLLTCLGTQSFAQGNVRDSSIYAPLVRMSYGVYLPGGDMADRFGLNSSIGLGASFKLKSQWYFGFEWAFHFSNNVTQDTILDGLKTSEGIIINAQGIAATVLLQERGHSLKFNAGRVFPALGPNPNCGIITHVGLGFFQHKIRIETGNDEIPQLSDELKKGYDRLTNGFLVSEFIGYQYLSSRRLVNFYAGFDFYQGFTRSRRSYNIDAMSSDTSPRLDLLFGFRAGWILPIYSRAPQDFFTF